MRCIKHRALLLGVVAIMLMTVLLCGCSSDKEKLKNPVFSEATEILPSQTVVANDQFSLDWDEEKACILLKENNTGKVWSTTPYDYYQTGEINEDLYSPIFIEYVNYSSKMGSLSKGYADCIKNKRISTSKFEEGIEVTYYFDSLGISVPIQYCLREDALAISVDFQNVADGENQLVAVSVAPFLCSVANNSEDSYLVVPSGSGGLMYVDEREEGTRTYSGELYGGDRSRLLPEELISHETVQLPFFGVKNGDNSLLAVIEEGDEAAKIVASAGDKPTGYSNAYVSFYARGYDTIETQISWDYKDLCRVSKTIDADKTTVVFYPLSGEDSGYTGMAKRYQEYLKDQGELSEPAKEQAYALCFTGGAQVKQLNFVGIPTDTTKALTTFKQAKTMINELVESTEQAPAVWLRGFGESGLTPGKVAGGFDFASVFGSNLERLSLEAFCKENEISLFTEFDLIYFRSSGNGYSTLTDVAKTASLHKVEQYYKDKALWHYDKESAGYYLLKREKLQSVVDKLEKTIKNKQISGISLASLGSVAYSDYSTEKYTGNKSTKVAVRAYLEQLSESGTPIATQNANAYAAVLSDTIFDVALDNGNYSSLDVSVPLYQMVFKGYVPLYSEPINAATDYEQAVMLAVQSGTSLGFSLIGKYDVDFAATPFAGLNASSYEGNKDRLVQTITECEAYYSAIQGQNIVAYEIVTEHVTKTTFSNGVIVYANHSDEKVASPVGDLEAYGFTFELEVEEE